MSTAMFRPATRKKVRLRMALDGPSGAGKTFTALRFAFSLGQRVAVINTESGAIEKYLGLKPDGVEWQFDLADLGSYAPTDYTAAILAAGKAGYDVLLIDSLSHAWEGEGGVLEQVDRKGGNKFTDGWKDVTPQHRRMVEAILRSPCHVIATMRTKMAYVLEEGVNRQGKTVQVPRKVGMAPIQRAGMEYEFDIVGDIDHTHTLTVSKTRCPDIDGAIVVKPGAPFIQPVVDWLQDGTDTPEGFYTASEDDLKASEEVQEEKKRRGRKPKPPEKVDVEALMRQAAGAPVVEVVSKPGQPITVEPTAAHIADTHAGEAPAAGTPASRTPATAAPPQSVPFDPRQDSNLERIDANGINSLKLLMTQAKLSTESAVAMIAQHAGFDGAKLKDLTPLAGKHMAARLNELIAAGVFNRPPSSSDPNGAYAGAGATAGADEGRVDEPRAPAPASPNGHATRAQLLSLRTMIPDLEKKSPGIEARVNASLAKSGKSRLEELSINGANGLIDWLLAQAATLEQARRDTAAEAPAGN